MNFDQIKQARSKNEWIKKPDHIAHVVRLARIRLRSHAHSSRLRMRGINATPILWLCLQMNRIDVASVDELDAAIARAKGCALVVLGDPMFGLDTVLKTARALGLKIRQALLLRADEVIQ